MGNEALPSKWNSFGITPSVLSRAHNTPQCLFTEGTTACWGNLSGALSPGRRRFMGILVEVNKSCGKVFVHR